jgi:hypothetical protein
MRIVSHLFRAVCEDADPAGCIAKLSDGDLVQLHSDIAAAPDTGIPGVVKAQVIAEQAKRFRLEQEGGDA